MSTERLGQVALAALVVGLALHNTAMATLWELGLRGRGLDVVAAWKEALLLGAVLVLAWRARGLPGVTTVDVLAGAYAAVLVVYFVLPQDLLDGGATARGELLALRHHLLPVGAYFLGRLVSAAWRPERLGLVVLLTTAGVALIGLLDLAFIDLQAWRESGVPGWYREQLDLDYRGLTGLPENWVYNTGDEENPIRRLVSTFLSPLASAYAFVVALLLLAAWPFRWWTGVLGVLLFVGLLYTHTRAAVAALAVGLVLLALLQRRAAPLLLAGAAVAVSAVFFVAYPDIGPSTRYTEEELEFLRQNAAEQGGTSTDPFSPSESSLASHWRNLRDGVREVLEHPQGYGPGNSGVVAKRTGVEIKGGESTYVELGLDTGLPGLVAFLLWSGALLVALVRREPWVAVLLAATLLLGLQTDVIGVHWLTLVVWGFAGLALAAPRDGPNGAVPAEEEG